VNELFKSFLPPLRGLLLSLGRPSVDVIISHTGDNRMLVCFGGAGLRGCRRPRAPVDGGA
jgi:hypothetical protein